MPAVYDSIQLHADEWGNDLMRRVAEDHLARHPEIDFVLILEHAGWYLGFRRDGTCWATANDGAIIRGPQPDSLRRCLNRNFSEDRVAIPEEMAPAVAA